MVGALCGSTQQEPLVVGKPSTFMMDYLSDKYASTFLLFLLHLIMFVTAVFLSAWQNLIVWFMLVSVTIHKVKFPYASDVGCNPARRLMLLH